MKIDTMHSMPDDPLSIDEQLSAWMDGELPEDQVRFLQRRLAHDPLLRARWQRWQLASACLRGQAVLPVDVSERVSAVLSHASALAEPDAKKPVRWVGWAAAAVMVIALMPRMGGESVNDSVPVVVESPTVPAAGLRETASFLAPTSLEPLMAEVPRQAPSSPLAAPSVVDSLPLTSGNAVKPWPRSPLVAREGAALEHYLIRHNGLLAEDGGGVWMPQVDVITHDISPASGTEVDGQ